MKRLVPLVVSLAVALAASPLRAAPERYALDPEHLAVAFLVEHMGFAKTLGRFTETEGSFVWDPETRTLSELRVVVATDSVASDHKARDRHVRGKDFLHVREHPEMVFEAPGPIVVDGDAAVIEGTLTLLGESRPLALETTLNKTGTYPFGHKKRTLGVSARGMVKRSDYGMSYGVANGLVGDEVELIIELEAIRDGNAGP